MSERANERLSACGAREAAASSTERSEQVKVRAKGPTPTEERMAQSIIQYDQFTQWAMMSLEIVLAKFCLRMNAVVVVVVVPGFC